MRGTGRTSPFAGSLPFVQITMPALFLAAVTGFLGLGVLGLALARHRSGRVVIYGTSGVRQRDPLPACRL